MKLCCCLIIYVHRSANFWTCHVMKIITKKRFENSLKKRQNINESAKIKRRNPRRRIARNPKRIRKIARSARRIRSPKAVKRIKIKMNWKKMNCVKHWSKIRQTNNYHSILMFYHFLLYLFLSEEFSLNYRLVGHQQKSDQKLNWLRSEWISSRKSKFNAFFWYIAIQK